ncbi:hypothetical protein L218DRAFT_943811 [Marasmius fiardii PR-910]|nr:hypothetical protein L218DRAFT_943811 [Marasmius fiardii PR-910]
MLIGHPDRAKLVHNVDEGGPWEYPQFRVGTKTSPGTQHRVHHSLLASIARLSQRVFTSFTYLRVWPADTGSTEREPFTSGDLRRAFSIVSASNLNRGYTLQRMEKWGDGWHRSTLVKVERKKTSFVPRIKKNDGLYGRGNEDGNSNRYASDWATIEMAIEFVG